MELQIPDSLELTLGADCEFQLPNYVVKLEPHEIDRNADMNHIVIAAGSDPSDGKITLITATGRICVFDSNKYCIPKGPALPTRGGLKIFLKNTEGRWPCDSLGFYVSTVWMLKNSEPALKGAVLQTNYRHENHHR